MRARNFIFILLMALPGCDQIAGPRDYDDCILKSMKGVNSDMAARAIVMSCRKKFPVRKPEDMAIPPDAMGQLTGHAGMGDFGYFSGNIYNGNKDWTVTQVTIMLVPKGKGKDAAAFLNAKEYNEDVTVSPLTSASFFLQWMGQRRNIRGTLSLHVVTGRG